MAPKPTPAYIATGNQDPRANGYFYPFGLWEEEPTYKHETSDLYIWLMEGAVFIISEFVGDISNGNYYASEGPILGTYNAEGDYSGSVIIAAP